MKTSQLSESSCKISTHLSRDMFYCIITSPVTQVFDVNVLLMESLHLIIVFNMQGLILSHFTFIWKHLRMSEKLSIERTKNIQNKQEALTTFFNPDLHDSTNFS
jgi:hypothetical protein